MKMLVVLAMAGSVFCGLVLMAVAQTTYLERIAQAEAALTSMSLKGAALVTQQDILAKLALLKTQLPVDCVLGDWARQEPPPAWSACAPDGTQTRTETWTKAVVTPAANEGKACDATSETRVVTQACTYVPPSAHTYFDTLKARADLLAAYSLREQAQIEQYRRSKTLPSAVVYDPATDAAKITVTGASLTTQVWLPISVTSPMKGVFITWDARFGKEWDKSLTGIGQYKAWQFCSPVNDIWDEINTVFHSADPVNVAHITGRYYNSARGPNVTSMNDLKPQVGQFSMKPDTWTRFYALFDTDSAGWDTYSLWASDGSTAPVQLFDKLQLKTRQAKLGVFRLEYNTSSVALAQFPKIAYARNVVMLKGVTDVQSLLVQPAK